MLHSPPLSSLRHGERQSEFELKELELAEAKADQVQHQGVP